MMRPRRALLWWGSLSPVAWICLITGLGALAAALLGAIINPLVGNWFHSTGMAMVGLFYLSLFVSNLRPRGIAAIGAADALPDAAHWPARERRAEPAEEWLIP